MTLLTRTQIDAALAGLPGWSVSHQHLVKTWKEMSFSHALMFMAAVGQYADAAGHHPDLSLQHYSEVTVRITTHSAGGLTEQDVTLARQIETLPHKQPKQSV
jgi:4a-hydroxytetrahydrobiopterin dehydratase